MPVTSTPSVTTLSPKNERLLLYTLAGVQFTSIIDFVILMPLGANLMRAFGIGPSQFGILLASYAISAGVSGLLGGFFIDRYDRKSTLLFLYAGFTFSLIFCAFSSNYETLLMARIATGAFGGLCISLLNSMIGDAIPPERRGKAMGKVMAAHPIALIIGVPTGLILASSNGWNAPYYILGGLCLIILCCALKTLPHVSNQQSDAHPARHMWNLLKHPVHLRAFLLRAGLVMSGGTVMPFLAPVLVLNVGLDEKLQIPLVYLFGGMFTFFSIPLMGRLSDRFDKVWVLAGISAIALPSVLVITRLESGPLALTYLLTTIFFVGMTGRFAPVMSLITNSVGAKFRGGFMSLNTSVQHTCGGIANLIGGFLVTIGADGKLHGYPTAGWFACGGFILTLMLAAWLRSAVPHAAKNNTIDPTARPAM